MRAAPRLVALVAPILFAACGGDGPSEPREEFPTPAVAMRQLSAAFDADSGSDRAANFQFAMMALYGGSAVTPLTVTIEGQEQTFAAVGFSATIRDSADTNGDQARDAIRRDSLIVVFAWRGDKAQESLLLLYVTDPQESNTTGGGFEIAAAGYWNGDALWHTTEQLSAASATLTPSATACTTRTELDNERIGQARMWLTFSQGCTVASFNARLSAGLVADPQSGASGTRRLDVAQQATTGIRLYFDFVGSS